MFLLAALLPVMTGCLPKRKSRRQADPAQQLATQMEKVRQALQEGRPDHAASILEGLSRQHPANAEILETLAYACMELKDRGMAAFYFEQAGRLDLERSEAFLYAAQAHVSEGDLGSAVRNYRLYLGQVPNDISAWKSLGEVLRQQQAWEGSLEAWLKAISLAGQTPIAAQDAAVLGQLFHKLGNVPQAESWYNTALQQDPKQSDCLLGMAELKLRQKNWDAAAKFMQTLEQTDPEALQNSPIAAVKQQTLDLQQLKGELQKKTLENVAVHERVAKLEGERKQLQEVLGRQEAQLQEKMAQVANLQAQAVVAAASAKKARETATALPQPMNTVAASIPLNDPVAKLRRDGVILDIPMESLEESVMSGDGAQIQPQSQASAPVRNPSKITVNRTLAPVAAPAPAKAARPQPQPASDLISGNVDMASSLLKAAPEGSQNDLLDLSVPEPADEKAASQPAPVAPKVTAPEVFSQANQLASQGQNEEAIKLFWKAIALDDTKAEYWEKLSRAYTAKQDYTNAEMTILEALRRAPGDRSCIVHYLNTIQRTMGGRVYLQELIRYHEQYEDRPEITLALAQAYEQIDRNPAQARALYEDYLKLVPATSPRTRQVQEKLRQLGGPVTRPAL